VTQPGDFSRVEELYHAVVRGTRLGPYEVTELIGAGGMGEVYRARDTRLGRDVAVKVLPEHVAKKPEALARFAREARTIAGLNHPHICALHDVGREGEIDYLVMELLEGETLARRLERGALPLDQVLRCGIEIAEALGAAHARGVVHRDLKPGNVMLTRSGAKLLDFGSPSPTGGGRVRRVRCELSPATTSWPARRPTWLPSRSREAWPTHEPTSSPSVSSSTRCSRASVRSHVPPRSRP
jgi:serine/threonine protein kinase